MHFACEQCGWTGVIADEDVLVSDSIECPECGPSVTKTANRKHSKPAVAKRGQRPLWKRWKWRGGIARASHIHIIVSWFAVFILSFVAFVFYKAEPNVFRLSMTSWGWLFVLGSLGLAVRAVMKTIRGLRFRGVHVRLMTIPGVIGGRFSAELRLRQFLPRGTVIKLRLLNQVIRTTWSQDQKARKSIHPGFQEIQEVAVDELQYTKDGYVIPFECDIPASAKDETDDSCGQSSSVAYCWLLQATAELSGADMDLEFSVPVFHVD